MFDDDTIIAGNDLVELLDDIGWSDNEQWPEDEDE